MNILDTIKLFKKGYGQYKLQILILAVLGLLSGLAEGIGVTALIPVFAKVAGTGEANDVISRALSYFFDRYDFGLGLKALLLFIVLAFLLKAVVLVIAQYISAKIETNYAKEARVEILGGVMKASWPFLTSRKGGYLETALLVDVDRSRMLLRYLSTSVLSLATLLVYALVAFNISPIITLLSLVSGAILFLFIKGLLYRMRQISGKVTDTNKKMAHFVSENVAGLKSVKSFSAESSISTKANRYFETLKNSHFKLILLSGIINVSVEPVSIVFVVGVFSFSYLSGDFQFAAFAALMYLIHRIFTKIQSVQGVLSQMSQSIPYLEHIVKAKELAAKNEEEHSGTGRFQFENKLEFKKVHFSYGANKGVLAGISFSVPRGNMIGIVGKSGSGKTTLADLLLCLITPQKGDITVDSVSVKDINIKDWRGNIGYVSQDVFVLNDTIENNIRFHNENITEEDMRRAAQMAYIYEFITSQPKGFKAEVGERGVMISGGEKQRLVLARVLARNPQILILDEATSALDNESELMVQKAIEGLRGKTTMFVIAHRLSTLLNCDKIFILEGGKIKEDGSPKELLKDKTSHFYKTYNIREDTQ